MAAEKITARSADYSQWYLDIVNRAGLAENSDVRGCMVIKPHGYAIWEKMQRGLDRLFKDTGHVNAYFPLLIPKSFLARGADGGGLRQGVRRRHALPAQGDPRQGRRGRSGGEAGGGADHPADLRDDHLAHLQELDPELPRSAAAHQPVVQRGALGDAHAAVPAHGGVPVAGGPHRPRHAAGGGGRDETDGGSLSHSSPRNGWRCRCWWGRRARARNSRAPSTRSASRR